MTEPEPFEMPDWDADPATCAQALERLNAVRMTIDQLERGYSAYESAQADYRDPDREEKRMSVLVAFCEAEGLHPADVAAHAILARWAPINEGFAGCYDYKTEYPEGYARFATSPIDPMYLGWEIEEEESAEIASDEVADQLVLLA